MAKKKTKKVKETNKEKKISLVNQKRQQRAKMIGQHIGYRYDVNLTCQIIKK